MPKPINKEFDKECPICGGLIWGKGQRILLEGATISVCQNCSQYGVKIQHSSSNTSDKKPYPLIKNKPFQNKIYKEKQIDDLEIIPDFAKKIRNVRNSLGLNQDQFAHKLNEKPSLLRRIETGKAKPTIELAKKIQKIYNIKLLHKSDEIEADVLKGKYMKKSTGSTLGNIAFIKKKKNDD